ncbi:MAG TPA: hypothetical protein VNN19_00605, partial [bacterium]|nr:hypothetical protein [bacterium]
MRLPFADPSASATGKGGPWGLPLEVVAIAALAVIVRTVTALGSHFTSEDFLITLRYAENLAAGRGFVYNAGERVLGTTTPLYTLVLALVARLGLPPVPVGKALNLLADGGLCLVLYGWLRRLGHESAGRLAAFWAAVHPLHIRWAVSGMETSLVTLCGALAVLAWMHRRYAAAYLALGVLFLLRWDGLLLAAVLTAGVLWRERRIPLREAAPFALLAAPWVAFATAYFGNPIPGTAAAKLAVYGWHAGQPLFPGAPGMFWRWIAQPAPAAATLAALVGLSVLRRNEWALAWPALGWFGLYVGALAASPLPLFEWYLVPPLPVHDALTALGVAALAGGLTARLPARRIGWLAGAAVAVVAATLWSVHSCRRTQQIEDHLRRPLGLWLRRHSAPGDRVMLEPIGYIGYYSQRR